MHVRHNFRPLIVCYHAVSDSWPHYLAVSPAVLSDQLALLIRRGYRPARLEDTIAVRRHLLHVTFDDAFASVNNGLPVLERLGIPCTIFVCTDFADTGRALDIPELRAQLEAHPRELVTLNWAQLAALPEDLVEIGSHTASHAHLTELDDAELLRQLTESRGRIEEQLGRPCRYLAYPFGEEDGRVRAAARKAGYLAALAVPGHPRPADDYGIPRVALFPHDGSLRTAIKASWPGRRITHALRDLRRKMH
jgi:peptidoglycan/xylan/chitin deacetylase (PgdA/CDA1 family)